MAIRTQQTATEGLDVRIGWDASTVRMPRMESAADYYCFEEQLSSEFHLRPATNWILDLSEYTDGITLVLAGVLASIGDKARRSGCTVKCTGLQEPCTKCEARCGTPSFLTGRAVKRNWMANTEELSFLCG